jgi:signal transduction histidine kinase
MTRNIRLLLFICILAIGGVIALQFLLISNYYKTSLFNFEREVNLSMDDAVKKEFQLRCDIIQQELVGQLMDTTIFQIRSRSRNFREGNKDSTHIIFSISNARNPKDSTSFSSRVLNRDLQANDTAYKRLIAQHYALLLRTEDLDNRIVYYRTQNLGQFLTNRLVQISFDTSRLKQQLLYYLSQRHITSPFYFQLSQKDSFMNHTLLPDSVSSKGYILSKSYPTYKWWATNEQYVRAVFTNPIGFIRYDLRWIFTGSVMLIILVAACISLLTSALWKEKKLTAIRNDLIHNISHELKTPAAVVTAALEVLQEPDISKDRQSKYLLHARNSMKKFSDLIDRILDIAIYDQKGEILTKDQVQPIPIATALQSISEQVQLIADKPVTIQIMAVDKQELLWADPVLFEQALTNILDNAIKYSPEKAEISIELIKEGHYRILQIADRGTGIPEDAIPLLFEKFYRVPQATHAIKGYGLGLAHVHQIMKVHGGKVTIKNNSPKGTIVYLYWPHA